jgi:hypothetical protein
MREDGPTWRVGMASTPKRKHSMRRRGEGVTFTAPPPGASVNLCTRGSTCARLLPVLTAVDFALAMEDVGRLFTLTLTEAVSGSGSEAHTPVIRWKYTWSSRARRW